MYKGYIYGLKDPRDNMIKYVGQSWHVYKRYADHCRDGGNISKTTNKKCLWVRELYKLNLKPELEILEEIEFEGVKIYPSPNQKILDKCEIKWINKLNPCKNTDKGGHGGGGGGQKVTHDKYIKRLYKKYGDEYTCLESYITSVTSIKHRHNKCGYEWKVRPANLLQDQGCPVCAGNFPLNTETYMDKLSKKYKGKIKVLEEYINYSTKIEHICLVCNTKWFTSPISLLSPKRKLGCPVCSLPTRSNKEYDELIKNLKIKRLEDYIKGNLHVLHRCLVCNYEWKVTPTSILNRNSGCPKCANSYSPSPEEYKIIVEKITKGAISALDDYETNRKKLKYKCNVCNHIWKTRPLNIRQGTHCPKCSLISRQIQIVGKSPRGEILFFDSMEEAKRRTGLISSGPISNACKFLCNDGKRRKYRKWQFMCLSDWKNNIKFDDICNKEV